MSEKKVLVTFATKYGATPGIAEKIADVIRKSNHFVDIVPVEQLPDPSPFHTVILGSAVYIGKWRSEAELFLSRYQEALMDRMVWLFSSGPTGSGNPVEIMKGWEFPKNLKALTDRIRPRGTVLFHGAIDMQKCNVFERFVIRGIKAPIGDFRDWNMISEWAEQIVGNLQGS